MAGGELCGPLRLARNHVHNARHMFMQNESTNKMVAGGGGGETRGWPGWRVEFK